MAEPDFLCKAYPLETRWNNGSVWICSEKTTGRRPRVQFFCMHHRHRTITHRIISSTKVIQKTTQNSSNPIEGGKVVSTVSLQQEGSGFKPGG